MLLQYRVSMCIHFSYRMCWRCWRHRDRLIETQCSQTAQVLVAIIFAMHALLIELLALLSWFVMFIYVSSLACRKCLWRLGNTRHVSPRVRYVWPMSHELSMRTAYSSDSKLWWQCSCNDAKLQSKWLKNLRWQSAVLPCQRAFGMSFIWTFSDGHSLTEHIIRNISKYPINNTPFLLENTILHGKTSVYSWVCRPHLACLGLAWSMREVTKPRWSARDWADASQTKQCKGPSLGDFASLCKSILMDPLVVFGTPIRTVPRMQSVALGSPHLMIATMLSCNFSLEAIRWMEGISVWCAAPSQLQGREMPAMLREASCDVHVFRPLILNREWWRVRLFDIAWSVSGNSSVTWSVTVVLCCCSRRSSQWHRPVAGWMQMHLSHSVFSRPCTRKAAAWEGNWHENFPLGRPEADDVALSLFSGYSEIQ